MQEIIEYPLQPPQERKSRRKGAEIKTRNIFDYFHVVGVIKLFLSLFINNSNVKQQVENR